MASVVRESSMRIAQQKLNSHSSSNAAQSFSPEAKLTHKSKAKTKRKSAKLPIAAAVAAARVGDTTTALDANAPIDESDIATIDAQHVHAALAYDATLPRLPFVDQILAWRYKPTENADPQHHSDDDEKQPTDQVEAQNGESTTATAASAAAVAMTDAIESVPHVQHHSSDSPTMNDDTKDANLSDDQQAVSGSSSAAKKRQPQLNLDASSAGLTSESNNTSLSANDASMNQTATEQNNSPSNSVVQTRKRKSTTGADLSPDSSVAQQSATASTSNSVSASKPAKRRKRQQASIGADATTTAALPSFNHDEVMAKVRRQQAITTLNASAAQRGLSQSQLETERLAIEHSDKQFLLLFKGQSHLHCEWHVPSRFIHESPWIKNKLLRFWEANQNSPCVQDESDVPPFPPEYCEVDRILDDRYDELHAPEREYLCKWKSLNYSQCTWERWRDFKDQRALDQYRRHNKLPAESATQHLLARPPASDWKALTGDETYMNGNKLRPWQVEGVSWLCWAWHQQRSVILADEMGSVSPNDLVACSLSCASPCLTCLSLDSFFGLEQTRQNGASRVRTELHRREVALVAHARAVPTQCSAALAARIPILVSFECRCVSGFETRSRVVCQLRMALQGCSRPTTQGQATQVRRTARYLRVVHV